jgi:hypothetical protein
MEKNETIGTFYLDAGKLKHVAHENAAHFSRKALFGFENVKIVITHAQNDAQTKYASRKDGDTLVIEITTTEDLCVRFLMAACELRLSFGLLDATELGTLIGTEIFKCNGGLSLDLENETNESTMFGHLMPGRQIHCMVTCAQIVHKESEIANENEKQEA